MDKIAAISAIAALVGVIFAINYKILSGFYYPFSAYFGGAIVVLVEIAVFRFTALSIFCNEAISTERSLAAIFVANVLALVSLMFLLPSIPFFGYGIATLLLLALMIIVEFIVYAIVMRPEKIRLYQLLVIAVAANMISYGAITLLNETATRWPYPAVIEVKDVTCTDGSASIVIRNIGELPLEPDDFLIHESDTDRLVDAELTDTDGNPIDALEGNIHGMIMFSSPVGTGASYDILHRGTLQTVHVDC